MADLSRVTARTSGQSRERLVDRRTSILPERRDTRTDRLQAAATMATARRGDGGAEALMRSLGMVTDAARDFQQYANTKFAKDVSDNAARGALDQAAGAVDEEKAGRSYAYRNAVARGRTMSAWNDNLREFDEELRAVVEQQDQLTLEERQADVRDRVETFFEGFAVDSETGQLRDFLATPESMRYLAEQMGQTRPQFESLALQRIEERFNEEAIGHFTKSVRDQADRGHVDLSVALSVLPPTVRLDKVRAALLDTVPEIAAQLEETGRALDGVQLFDSLLAGGIDVDGTAGETLDATTLAAVRGPAAVDVPPSTTRGAPDTTPAPAFSPAAFKAAVRGPESGGDDSATNSMGSSASGRYQFVEGTFKRLYKRVYGATSGQAREAWASKRFDVAVQEKLMDALIADNQKALTAIGKPISTANMYIMHVLGAGDGPRFLQADPNTPVDQLLSATIVRQNPTYFGGGKTVAQSSTRIASAIGAGSGEDVGGSVIAPDPTYASPSEKLSPIELYIRGPKPAFGAPVMTGGLALTPSERRQLLQVREAYIAKATAQWHRDEKARTDRNATSLMMGIFDQGPIVTAERITSMAEDGDIGEDDAVRLYGMLQSKTDRAASYADRAEAKRDRAAQEAEDDEVDAITAHLLRDAITGKKSPEEVRTDMLRTLKGIGPSVAARVISGVGGTLNGLENVQQGTAPFRDGVEMLDRTDRHTIIRNALRIPGIPAAKRDLVEKLAGNRVDQAIMRYQRDVTNGKDSAAAMAAARSWAVQGIALDAARVSGANARR
ncbi:hypothetical protein [Sphingopyxis sp. PAMC25046]|uniref:hypothetical protein n=1 Tax=Sphingopyxis sp. PAMC25046 TaxID=2565556 RepID=UPI001448492C|nr:hypothetical protein [Sphingopyxis sp. PAMC25046]